IAAGAAEASMAVLSKAFADKVDGGFWSAFRSWEPYVLVAVGIATLTVVQSSYQVGRPTIVLPVNTVTEPLVAASIGAALFRETLHIAGWRSPVVALALGTMTVGLIVLARTSALTGEGAPEGVTKGVPDTAGAEAAGTSGAVAAVAPAGDGRRPRRVRS